MKGNPRWADCMLAVCKREQQLKTKGSPSSCALSSLLLPLVFLSPSPSLSSSLPPSISDPTGDYHQPAQLRLALVSVSAARSSEPRAAPTPGPLQHLPSAVQETPGEPGGDHHLQVLTHTHTRSHIHTGTFSQSQTLFAWLAFSTDIFFECL